MKRNYNVFFFRIILIFLRNKKFIFFLVPVLLTGYCDMHSKNRSHIVAALSLAHLASSCRGLRPLRFTASASSVHSVNNVRTTDT